MIKLNVLAILAGYNHHTSMARAALDTLEVHGISVDNGHGPTHIGIGDLFAEKEDDDGVEIESWLAMLREAHLVDGPEMVRTPAPGPAIGEAERDAEQIAARRKLREAAEAPLTRTPKKHKGKAKKKRVMSPEGRERIAAAQKKRWAAHRGETV